MNNVEIIALLDLTLLDKKATSDDIKKLAVKANSYQTAAICVLPEHIQFATLHPKVKCATVVNFPEGLQSKQHVLSMIEKIANTQRVQEIDYVFPYQAYLKGEKHAAIDHCSSAYQLCKQHDLTFKVILETGAFPSETLLYDVSKTVIKSGCDFLKTSTGKIAVGATIKSVTTMLNAIIDSQASCGIKVSGGIKTKQDALAYIQLAKEKMQREVNNTWFRIGASSLLDEIIQHQATPQQ